MGFKTRVHTTRTTVVQPQPFRRTIEQVHRFCFVFSTAHCPPYFVNMMYFFREKKCEHTEYGVSALSIYFPRTYGIWCLNRVYILLSAIFALCLFVVLYIDTISVMHISRVDSVHRLLRRRLQQNRACRSRFARPHAQAAPTRPPAQRNRAGG